MLFLCLKTSVAEPHYFDAAPNLASAPESQNDVTPVPAPFLLRLYCKIQKIIHLYAAPGPALSRQMMRSLRFRLRNTFSTYCQSFCKCFNVTQDELFDVLHQHNFL
jgi:hypothetical protein